MAPFCLFTQLVLKPDLPSTLCAKGMKESKNWVSNTPKHQCRQERKKGIAGEMKEWKEQMKR
jgi:hypothetical protein